MATYAMIKDGVVINTVIASETDFKDPAYVWVDITGTDIGVDWITSDNINFTQPVQPE